MKFLIRENFFKNIKKEKIEEIEKNLNYFYKEILKNINNIRNIPKGFWIKKINGIENRYEFRVNNGDRIFFSLDRRQDEEEKITFILYSTHDFGVKKSKKALIKEVKQFEIDKSEFSEETFEIPNEVYLDYNQVISYEIKDDEEFKKEGFSKSKYFYYYLNDEQYKVLKEETPLLVAGSAGSGKSTITIRKILNLEEYRDVYDIKKIVYFTGNTLLKESIEEQYNLFREKEVKKITEFYTPREFYRKFLKIDTRKIVRLKKFKEFLAFSFPDRKKMKIEDFNIYFEIMGILKGLMFDKKPDNWNRDLNQKLIPFSEYVELNKNYSLLNLEEKEFVYKVAEKYEEWKLLNGLYDMNDLAVRSIDLDLKYDFLIVDEIQDFTEVEIFFMTSIIKKIKNVLFAGDIHQMINFNSFSFERLRNYYFTQNFRNYNEVTLSKNYRNSKDIVELANFLTDLRKEYIGNLGVKDYKENFIVDRGKITLMKPDYELLKIIQQDVKFAILVSSKEEKYNLDKFYDIHMRVFSIDEIKGLEYDNVICLNLATTNLFAWEKIFNKEVKRDQRYRKYFNLFYVGITRCKKNLTIMEDKIYGNLLLEKIKDFITESSEENKEKITKEINISNKEEWLEEGKRLYNVENYEEAQKAFEMAGYPTWILEKNIEEDIENGDYKIALDKIEENELENKKRYYENMIIDTTLKREEFIKSLIFSVENFGTSYRYIEIKKIFLEKMNEDLFTKKELDRAIAVFSKKQENNILGEIYEKQQNYALALNFYKKSNNYMSMTRMRRKILEEKYTGRANISQKIKIVEELLGKKDINSYDKNKMTPLYNALKYQDIDIIDILLFLGANKNMKVQGKYDLFTYIAKENFENAIELYKYFLNKGYEYVYNPKVETPIEFSLAYRNRKVTDFIIESKLMEDYYKFRDANPSDICLNSYQVKYFKIFLKKMDLFLAGDKFLKEFFLMILALKAKNPIEKRKKEIMKKIFLRILSKDKKELIKQMKDIEKKISEKDRTKKKNNIMEYLK